MSGQARRPHKEGTNTSLHHLLPRNGFSFGGCGKLFPRASDARPVAKAMKQAAQGPLQPWVVDKCVAEMFVAMRDHVGALSAPNLSTTDDFWASVPHRVGWAKNLPIDLLRHLGDHLTEARLRAQEEGGFAADVVLGRSVQAIDAYVDDLRGRGLADRLPKIVPDDDDEDEDDDDEKDEKKDDDVEMAEAATNTSAATTTSAGPSNSSVSSTPAVPAAPTSTTTTSANPSAAAPTRAPATTPHPAAALVAPFERMALKRKSEVSFPHPSPPNMTQTLTSPLPNQDTAAGTYQPAGKKQKLSGGGLDEDGDQEMGGVPAIVPAPADRKVKPATGAKK